MAFLETFAGKVPLPVELRMSLAWRIFNFAAALLLAGMLVSFFLRAPFELAITVGVLGLALEAVMLLLPLLLRVTLDESGVEVRRLTTNAMAWKEVARWSVVAGARGHRSVVLEPVSGDPRDRVSIPVGLLSRENRATVAAALARFAKHAEQTPLF